MSAVWHPRTEADLAASIKEGMLAETHHQDVKRELGAKPGDRKELARDLAQFGLDGGQLIIGIDEDKDTRTWTLAPQPLAGLSERIELIARSNITPELTFITHTIPSGQDPALGYVIVEVPASASAPHMVDWVYYGRGDTTRIRLSDAEVARWLRLRRNDTDRARELLLAEIDRDPIQPSDSRKHGHMYLVAEPQLPRPDLARELVRGPSDTLQRTIMFSAEQDVHPDLRRWAPTPSEASSLATRAAGVAFCHHAVSRGRAFTPGNSAGEDSVVDVEITGHGGIRVFVGRLTDEQGNPSEPVILDGLMIAYLVRLVRWASSISAMTDYTSGWSFGVAGNGLRGRSSAAFLGDRFESGSVYDQDHYQAATTASGTELSAAPEKITERLVGPLLRGLGTAERYAPHLAHRRTI